MSMRILIIISILFVIDNNTRAQLSPGELHKSHAELEGVNNCTKCHESSKKLSSENCLSCHKILHDRIKNNKGLHALSRFQQCESCHVEHHGRNFDLIYWEAGLSAFDHSQTGYTLSGAHAKLNCRNCHKSQNIAEKDKFLRAKKDLNRTFLGLSRECLSCHRDEHRGQIVNPCTDCHDLNAWKPVPGFNHQNTSFPLTGKHLITDCKKCHNEMTDKKLADDASYLSFKPGPHQSCTDCHRDVHAARFGTKCTKCHSTKGWSTLNTREFNHDLTNFALKGKHDFLSCPSCHRPGKPLKIKKYQKCRDCHTDYHKGVFDQRILKGACEECHIEESFSPSRFTVSQHAETKYPLQGAHLAVPCLACHKKQNSSIIFRFSSIRCQTCHPDPHRGQVDKYLSTISTLTNFAGCEHCHRNSSWSDITFDHDLTNFALSGQHTKIKCSACHQKDHGGIILIKLTQKSCQACHKDVHLGQFSYIENDCSKCHTPSGWLEEKFDHNKQSKFPLEGRHALISCAKCHQKTAGEGLSYTLFRPINTDCKSCHGIKPQEKQDRQ